VLCRGPSEGLGSSGVAVGEIEIKHRRHLAHLGAVGAIRPGGRNVSRGIDGGTLWLRREAGSRCSSAAPASRTFLRPDPPFESGLVHSQHSHAPAGPPERAGQHRSRDDRLGGSDEDGHLDSAKPTLPDLRSSSRAVSRPGFAVAWSLSLPFNLLLSLVRQSGLFLFRLLDRLLQPTGIPLFFFCSSPTSLTRASGGCTTALYWASFAPSYELGIRDGMLALFQQWASTSMLGLRGLGAGRSGVGTLERLSRVQ